MTVESSFSPRYPLEKSLKDEKNVNEAEKIIEFIKSPINIMYNLPLGINEKEISLLKLDLYLPGFYDLV